MNQTQNIKPNFHANHLNQKDHKLISSIITPKASVLDLGCGNCSLLKELTATKAVRGRGVDINGHSLIEGMSQGIPVYQGDLDDGLLDFPDQSYDFVLLNLTLQVAKNPQIVLRELVRIGKFGIVTCPNFGHFSLRFNLFFGGRAPKSPTLPFEWYNTPNIRVLTIKDFRTFCIDEGFKIVREYHLIKHRWQTNSLAQLGANWFAELGLFIISQTDEQQSFKV